MSDVRTMLETWGRWSRDPCLPARVKCGIAIIMAHNVGGAIGMPLVSEEDAQLVERVMRVLKQRKPDHYAVLHAYYVKELSSRQIAKGSPWSGRMVYDMLKAGEAWIEGAMASSVLIA